MRAFQVLAVLSLSWLVGSAAQAQVDTMSLNFGKIEFEYRSERTGVVPLGLDLALGEEGSLRVYTRDDHSVQMQYAQFPAEPLPQAWLDFAVRGRDGLAGHLLTVIDQQQADAQVGGAGPHVRVIDARDGGSAVHTGGVNASFQDGSVRFIRDSVDVALHGAPASLFNQPRPGEALEARLPTPAPGQTIELVLKIWDDRGASSEVPVRVSRAI